MATYDEVVESFLTARGLEAEREDERTWLFRLAGEELSWLVSIVVLAQNDQIVVHGEVPVDVPPPLRSDLATWAARANRGLPIGNFEVDVDTGGVWCKSSIDVEGDELSDALLDNLVAAVDALLDRYAGPLVEWIEGRAPGPDEAVLVAEGFDP
jgi:hypothetical protein